MSEETILVLSRECESAIITELVGGTQNLRLLYCCASRFAENEESFKNFHKSIENLSQDQKNGLTYDELIKNDTVFEIFVRCFINDPGLYTAYAINKFRVHGARKIDLRRFV